MRGVLKQNYSETDYPQLEVDVHVHRCCGCFGGSERHSCCVVVTVESFPDVVAANKLTSRDKPLARYATIRVGDILTKAAPANTFPHNTVLSSTPVVREKLYLYVDSSGNYNASKPTLNTSSNGVDWTANNGLGTGASVAISTFFIATSSSTLAQINSALSSGKNLLLTPGIYKYGGASA